MLERWRSGDNAAADALVQRHFDGLCRFFRDKVGSGVEDLIQQTLLTMVERRDRFPSAWSFRTCLFRVARDRLYDQYRKGPAGRDFDPSLSSLQDLGPSPSAVLAQDEARRSVLEALRLIPLEMRVALELYYWEELSAPELARVLDIPEGTVRGRLRRGREALAAWIEKLGGSSVGLEQTLDSMAPVSPPP